MSLPRPHRADISGLRETKRNLQHRHIELWIVGEDADDGPAIDPARLDLGRQVAVGPVDDHFVGVREPWSESRTQVARPHTVTR